MRRPSSCCHRKHGSGSREIFSGGHSRRKHLPSARANNLNYQEPITSMANGSGRELSSEVNSIEPPAYMNKSEAVADLSAFISLDDFQRRAKDILARERYEYVASGTDDEQTLSENRQAFKRIFLVPRMMRDMSAMDLRVDVLGERLAMPILVSPAGAHKLMDPEGEVATARACAAAGTLMGVSQHSTVSLEDIATAAPRCPRWYQVYILKDRTLTADILRRAKSAGYTAICLTIDSVRFGSREADWRNSFNGLPSGLKLANYPTQDGYGDREKDAWDQNTEKLFDDRATWADIEWIKKLTALPVVIKGVLGPGDAVAAVNAGADALIVSNHGGRALDGALSSIESLRPIVEAVRGCCGGDLIPVLLDSGVRRGTDVLKALALGATAVLLGRPVFFSLAVGGQEGVERMLDIIRDELEAAMALCGCQSLQEINEDLVAYRGGGTTFHRPRL